ncbi:MAG: glycosyltransferase [Clostridium sp.]|uniref:glycosyltransferase n=1 Tax=Clostridium sp. TaxID=1506 RepID=UPI003994105A
MKKKILFMVSSMNIGGVEKSLLSLLAVIPKEKYEITILTLDKKGGFLEYIPNNVKLIEAEWFKYIKPIIMDSPQNIIKRYIKNYEFLKILSFIYSYFKTKKTNDRYIYYKHVLKSIPECKEKYDVAIAYAGPTEIIDAYISHKVKAEKKIAWVHFDISKHKINKKLYNNLYERFNKIFAVSNECKKKLDEIMPAVRNKSEVLLNIVSENLINEMSESNIDFDDNYKGIKIITVGRLSKEKGQDLAIKALAKLKKDRYDVKWYCIGEGNSRQEFEQLIKEYNLENDFLLLGATSNPYPYIKNADIYVQTSRHEGYCLTLAEAKVLNKPIVTTNFIGAYEQIKNNENGFIVSCNENDLADAIRNLIDEKKFCSKFSKKLREEKIDTTNEVNKLLDYI